jgi:hypothetical protein
MTDGVEFCSTHPNGVVWDSCTLYETETCADFCNPEEVTDSDCWTEGPIVAGEGGGPDCTQPLQIR